MKITFYFDVHPGVPTKYIWANTEPDFKAAGSKRYKVEVEIDDPAEPDKVLRPKAELC